MDLLFKGEVSIKIPRDNKHRYMKSFIPLGTHESNTLIDKMEANSLPNNGTASDVAGIVSATIFKNTVNDSKIVTPVKCECIVYVLVFLAMNNFVSMRDFFGFFFVTREEKMNARNGKKYMRKLIHLMSYHTIQCRLECKP